MKLNETQKKIYKEMSSGKRSILMRPRFRRRIPLPLTSRTNGLTFDKIIIDEYDGGLK